MVGTQWFLCEAIPGRKSVFLTVGQYGSTCKYGWLQSHGDAQTYIHTRNKKRKKEKGYKKEFI